MSLLLDLNMVLRHCAVQLFSRPDPAACFGSAIDINGSVGIAHVNGIADVVECGQALDSANIADDWFRVGNDLEQAAKKYRQAAEEKKQLVHAE